MLLNIDERVRRKMAFFEDNVIDKEIVKRTLGEGRNIIDEFSRNKQNAKERLKIKMTKAT